jgi:disulfide oxidoreductase YuzD
MTKKDLVEVKILELPGSTGGCACGSLPCTPEMAAMFKQKVEELRGALEENFPGQTRVEHVDLLQNPAEKESPTGQLLVTKKYPGPLVVINGEPKFAGSILVKKIVKEVANILTQ